MTFQSGAVQPGESAYRKPSALAWRLVLGTAIVSVVVGLFLVDHLVARRVLALRLLIAFLGAFALLEFYEMCRRKGHAPARVAGVLFLLASPLLWLGLADHRALLASPALFLLYLLLRLVVRHGTFTIESAALTILGYAYLSLLWLCMAFPGPVAGPAPGGAFLATYYILFVFLCSKTCDTAAYFAGKAMGRRKMAPSVSPQKTWEGAIGGGIAGAGTGFCVLFFSPLREAFGGVPAACLLLYALCVTIAAQAGDLVESAFKRWAGAKDSGRIPGLGGVLDMVDDFPVSFPVAYLLGEALAGLF